MPVLKEWNLALDVDRVLHGQGADPAIIRQRSPHLVEIAARALEESYFFLRPQVVYREFEVKAFRHEKLLLAGGKSLSGPFVAQHLGPAKRIIAALCTIGQELEAYASRLMAEEPTYGLAMDGAGFAAIDALTSAVCHTFESMVKKQNLRTSIPLSPGMIGWPVTEGQRQVSALLDASRIGIAFTDGGAMIPRKSLSMVIGVGTDMSTAASICEHCTLHTTCSYQHRR